MLSFLCIKYAGFLRNLEKYGEIFVNFQSRKKNFLSLLAMEKA